MLPEKIEIDLTKIESKKGKKSISSEIKDWLIPISSFITLISIAIGAYKSMGDYQLRQKAESRLIKTQNTELKIELTRQFIELMALANSRRGSHISEKAIESLFDKEYFTVEELNSPKLMNNKIQEVATINLFVGGAEQDAYILAATNLGLEHNFLREPAIGAMKSFVEQGLKTELTNECLIRLIEKRNKKINQ